MEIFTICPLQKKPVDPWSTALLLKARLVDQQHEHDRVLGQNAESQDSARLTESDWALKKKKKGHPLVTNTNSKILKVLI